MEPVDQLPVDLKSRLAAGENDPGTSRGKRPSLRQNLIERHPAPGLELGVAIEAVRLGLARQVAAGETEKQVRRAGSHTLALQAVEDLVDQIAVHAPYSTGENPATTRRPASPHSNRLSNRQAPGGGRARSAGWLRPRSESLRRRAECSGSRAERPRRRAEGPRLSSGGARMSGGGTSARGQSDPDVGRRGPDRGRGYPGSRAERPRPREEPLRPRAEGPRLSGGGTRIESREPPIESRETPIESRETHTQSAEACPEGGAARIESGLPPPESGEARTWSRQARTQGGEARIESREPRTWSRDPRTWSREPPPAGGVDQTAGAPAPPRQVATKKGASRSAGTFPPTASRTGLLESAGTFSAASVSLRSPECHGVAAFTSERWPPSRRNGWPDSLGIPSAGATTP